uniref:Uncharacterized protein n=1 Tax=Globisporangium ultimum (strain ATCC 200006 / CBS 805.95 / DAOM BR144) TaxID=431595 RepID=K3WY46_GLOUD
MAFARGDRLYRDQVVLLPLMLLLSFGLFQFLLVTYYVRRRELRGCLLLGATFLSFASLVPLAHPDENLAKHLSDISETCSTLTFLL